MNDWIFDCILDALDDARASVDFCSHIFTWLVIIGVAFEIWFLWLDHTDDFKAWEFARTRFRIPWPEKPARRKIFAEVSSVWLVVFGIWGEFHESVRSGRLETVARQVDGLRNTLLQQEARDAAINAETAHASADKADLAAEDSEGEAKKAHGLVRELAANVNATELLLAATASGHKFRPMLFASLKNSAPSLLRDVEMGCPPNTGPETKLYMRRLSETLNELKWHSSISPQIQLPRGESITSVEIFNRWSSLGPILLPPADLDSPLEEDISAEVNLLVQKGMRRPDAFRLARLGIALDAKFVQDPKLDDKTLRIVFVGKK